MFRGKQECYCNKTLILFITLHYIVFYLHNLICLMNSVYILNNQKYRDVYYM